MNKHELQPNTQLPNGATIIAIEWDPNDQTNGGYVIALTDQQLAPYATWWIDSEGNTLSGHYHDTLAAAIKNWNQRIKQSHSATN